MKNDLNRSRKIRRELTLEAVALHGPRHGRSGLHLSKRDKERFKRNKRIAFD